MNDVVTRRTGNVVRRPLHNMSLRGHPGALLTSLVPIASGYMWTLDVSSSSR